MPKLRLFLSIILPVLIGPSFAAGADLSTPEGAVAAYIEGVAERDFSAILEATAAENMSERADFVAFVDRLKALVRKTPLPTNDALFVEINKADFVAQIADGIKFLAYGLMTTNEVIDGKAAPMDAAGASEFLTVVRADRLAGLQLVKVGVPSPALMNKERYQVNAVKIAKTYGATTTTERVALVSFEGLHFVVGFSLLQYDDEWGVLYQFSPIAGTSALGTPQRVTPDEFEAMLR